MYTLAVIAQKGGVGKTTTAVNLACWFARTRRVLLLDCDPQGQCSLFLGVPWAAATHRMGELLSRHSSRIVQRPFVPAAQLVLSGVRPNLDLIASDARLVEAEELVARDPNSGRILARRLAELAPRYDLAVLDAPPGVSRISEMVLAAADAALVPVAPGAAPGAGLSELLERLEALAEAYGRAPEVTVCATLLDTRERVSQALLGALKPYPQAPSVRRNVRLAEAPGAGQSIFEYAPDSAGAADYQALGRFLDAQIQTA